MPGDTLPTILNPETRMVTGKGGRPVRLSIQEWLTWSTLQKQSGSVRIVDLRALVEEREGNVAKFFPIRRKGPLTPNTFSGTLNGLKRKLEPGKLLFEGKTHGRTVRIRS